MKIKQNKIQVDQLSNYTKTAVSRIAPLWSLENFVAVNPYLGMSEMKFNDAMNYLQKVGKMNATLPKEFYLEALEQKQLLQEDISKALKNRKEYNGISVDEFIEELYSIEEDKGPESIKIMADIASEINGKKWGRFMVDRISFWASAYFDQFQAVWDTAQQRSSLYEAWKTEAMIDYSPEAMGLKGFRSFVGSFPTDHRKAALKAMEILDIPHASIEAYLSALLMHMNGWSGFAARVDWDARLAGIESHVVEEFLSVLLVWEAALHQLLPYSNLEVEWSFAKRDMGKLLKAKDLSNALAQHLVLQEAFDIANQRRIIEKINQKERVENNDVDLKVQAIFCIDVRSEVYRRNLESVDSGIETMGFAGFFAFPVKYVPLGHDEGTDQCPVLLTTSHTVKESLDHSEERAEKSRRLSEQFLKVWKSFKSGTISCFSFVSPLGLYFLPKLISDAFGWSRPVPNPMKAGLSQKDFENRTVSLASSVELGGIPKEDRIKMAKNALNAMSLTENFAPIVLIVGHGANTVNNPHATGLDCGACGGHSGEANAKVAAAVLNDLEVREALRKDGLEIAESTLFVPALHDTTTDEVSLFNGGNQWPASHEKEIKELIRSLHMASDLSRNERAKRMRISSKNASNEVIHRSKDWSQVRPEWGLAGCSSFIVAPRERTLGLNLEGKSFMHNYNWKKDQGFGVLELIMTAPMVVTSWINLQYYASTVDNKKLGAGNKTLHNVVGGLGVLEGFAGDLKVGLPLQSVHDGEKFQHEPQRLNVIIEAPQEEMTKILQKHAAVKDLCDNGWIFLFAMNEEGKLSHQYDGNFKWKAI